MQNNNPKISIITSIYRGEEFIRRFLESLLSQTCLQSCEIIFVLNESSSAERNLIEEFTQTQLIPCTSIFLDKRENLGASWNRGILVAKGKYISFWNVDDIRTENSLAAQLATLESNPDMVITYGDFFETNSMDQSDKEKYLTPEFNKIIFRRRFATGGPFLLISREMFLKHGYFDEQLKVALDYEYILRLTSLGEKFKKTPGIMGYFLNQHSGLSTTVNTTASDVERDVIYHRYSIFDKISNPPKIFELGYDPGRFNFFGEIIEVKQFGINFEDEVPLNLYKKISNYIKNKTIFLIKNLGLWERTLKIRDRFLGYKEK